ncbi:MAG: hypothetical protein L0L69_04560 [Propionibacterium sp.]|nr:hypothetical protein [Propionibacterium sp.]
MAVIEMTPGIQAGPPRGKLPKSVDPGRGPVGGGVPPLSGGGSWAVVIVGPHHDRVISGFASSDSAWDFVNAYEAVSDNGILVAYPTLRLHAAVSRWAAARGRSGGDADQVCRQVGLRALHLAS